MENVSVEQALELISQQVRKVDRKEKRNLSDALGFVIAETVYAPISNPPFDRSPIDGYAIRANDSIGASKETPISLTVVEEIDAGQYSERMIQPGEAVRIMTGAPIPKGCDCCIRQESTDYGEETVQIYQEMKEHENYCDRGEDIQRGNLLIEEGTKLSFVEIGILSSVGITEVLVYEKPRIALITTGDEVISPGEPLRPGKIYNSNLAMMKARFDELGYPFTIIETETDDAHALAKRLERLSKQVDVIITTGGVSVGKKDILHEALPMINAERIFWRVLLKPGTPTIFSMYKGTPILSLSGNPFGAMTNTELLVRPMLAILAQDTGLVPMRLTGKMEDEFLKESKGRRFIRAYYENGKVFLPRKGLHSSGVLSSMAGCNCVIDITPGTTQLLKGDEVTVVLL